MCDCKFCTDLRNIEPASYISMAGGDPDWLLDAKIKNNLYIIIGRMESNILLL